MFLPLVPSFSAYPAWMCYRTDRPDWVWEGVLGVQLLGAKASDETGRLLGAPAKQDPKQENSVATWKRLQRIMKNMILEGNKNCQELRDSVLGSDLPCPGWQGQGTCPDPLHT